MSQAIKHRVILKPVREKGSIKGYKDGSSLFKYSPSGKYTETIAEESFIQYHELYILSDEMPKMGEFYHLQNKENKYSTLNGIFRRSIKDNTLYKGCKKIIATTDKTLWIHDDSVPYPKTKTFPSIPEWFIQLYIERYNRKDVIEEVLVAPDIITHGTVKIELIKETWSREEVVKLIHNVLKYMVRNFDESGALNALMSKTEVSKTIKPN